MLMGILAILGFILFGISMIIFNSKRLKKINAFPQNTKNPSLKNTSINLGGLEYFIFLKLDKELTIYAILAWIGLVLLLIANLIRVDII